MNLRQTISLSTMFFIITVSAIAVFLFCDPNLLQLVVAAIISSMTFGLFARIQFRSEVWYGALGGFLVVLIAFLIDVVPMYFEFAHYQKRQPFFEDGFWLQGVIFPLAVLILFGTLAAIIGSATSKLFCLALKLAGFLN